MDFLKQFNRFDCKNPKEYNIKLNELLEWIDTHDHQNVDSIIPQIIIIFNFLVPKLVNHFFISRTLHWIDEYIEDKNNQSKFIKLNLALSLPNNLNLWYKNGVLLKMLQSMDYPLISLLFNQKYDNNYGYYFKHYYLLPLPSLVNALKLVLNHSADNESNLHIIKENIIKMATTVVMAHIGNTKQFYKNILGNDDIDQTELPTKLTSDFVKSILELVILSNDNISKQKVENIDYFIRVLCFVVLNCLSEQEIQSLRDYYIQLIPSIFKYMELKITFKYRGTEQKRAFAIDTLSDEITVLKHHYGKDLIEKECENIFGYWLKNLNSGIDYAYTIGLINSILPNQIIRDNIEIIYGYLGTIDQLKQNDPNIILLLNNLISIHGKLSEKRHMDLLDYLLNEYLKINVENQKDDVTTTFPRDLMVTVLISNPELTISKFDELLDRFITDGSIFACRSLNRLISHTSIYTLMVSNGNYQNQHEKIIKLSSRSSEHRIYLLEYLMKTEADSFLVGMANEINDNISRFHVKDDHLHLTLLRFKQKLSTISDSNITQSQLFDIYKNTMTSYLRSIQSKAINVTLNHEIVVNFTQTDTESFTFLQLLQKSLGSPTTIPMLILTVLKLYIEAKKPNIDHCVSTILCEYTKSMKPSTVKLYIKILMKLKSLIPLDIYIKSLLETKIFSESISIFYKDVIPLLHNLQNPKEIYHKFFEIMVQSVPFKDHSEIIHSLLPSLSGQDLIECYHDLAYLSVDRLTFSYMPTDQKLDIIRYFKPLDTISTNLRDNILHGFKSITGKLEKESLLVAIRYEGIKVLEFLNDSKLTGFQYVHQLGIDYEKTLVNVPYIPHTLINNILKFSIRASLGISTQWCPTLLLKYAMVSKSFFKETCKILKNLDCIYGLSSNWCAISTNQWSLLQLGFHYLRFDDFDKFGYKCGESIYYQLSSLSIIYAFKYITTREMQNLTTLNIYHNRSIFEYILYLLENCYKLKKVAFYNYSQHNTGSSIESDKLESIIKTIISNNSKSIELIKFNFEFDRNIDYSSAKLLYKYNKEFMKSIPDHQTNRKQLIQGVCTFPHHLKLDIIDDALKAYSKLTTRLNIIYYNKKLFEKLFQPANFKRLEKLNINISLDKVLHDFMVSSSLKIRKLWISVNNISENDFEALYQMKYLETLILSLEYKNHYSLFQSVKKNQTLKVLCLQKTYNFKIEDYNTNGFLKVPSNRKYSYKFIRNSF
ncbi:hypothetical protein DLAC_00806 [Tieghemostelium lacteum]|uniref:Uncharacterized protein n=1 Tax=Tieghemostelium lacteum TaxID=361077 RepID=A0A152A738_TIELA|nr:hypothetical protein DLAC_00806 [Tieghemostelium lacteum]|eukprot:KYR02014.1 hypothetical protein DLAC_00806 [Tieghemostelium lacteum]